MSRPSVLFILVSALLLVPATAFAQAESGSDAAEVAAEVAEKVVARGGGIFPGPLTEAQRVFIDEYLEENGLNKFGDPADTVYTGGTPLYDERTGRRIDRYQFILRNRPGILRGFAKSHEE